MSAKPVNAPSGGRLRAVGTPGRDGLLHAVGIEPQPARARAVVEATVERLGPEDALHLLGSTVRLAPGVRVSGPDGRPAERTGIAAGTRLWLGGSWTPDNGFVADEVRVRPRREFEIDKVAGPSSGHDPGRRQLEIAGFTVTTSERTMFGAEAEWEDDE